MKTNFERLEAAPVQRISDRATGKTVGWVYRWNTGELATLWIGPECADIEYETLDALPSQDE